MEHDLLVITINTKFVLLTMGGLFTFVSFMVVLTIKMALNSINTTISNCHVILDANAKHEQIMNEMTHANHEGRLEHLESAVFKPRE